MGAEPTEGSRTNLSRAGLIVGALSLLHLTAWFLVIAAFHTAPSKSMAEALALGPEWLIASYRQPMLLSWALELFWQVAGYSGIALLAALPMALTYPLLWQLAKRLLPADQALAGVLLAAGIFYFTWPTPELDRNLLLMPFWAGLLLLFFDCLARPAVWRFPLLGFFAGIALYAAYQTIVLLLAIAIWMVWDSRARRQRGVLGPLLGLCALLLVSAPQLVFFGVNGIAPFAIPGVNADGLRSVLEFVPAQGLVLLPALGLAFVVGLFSLTPRWDLGDRSGDRFLLFFLAVPVLIAIFLAAILGTPLGLLSGAPMMVLAGLLLARWLSQNLDRGRLRRLATAALILVGLVPVLWAAAIELLPQFTAFLPLARWPQRAISREVDRLANAETGESARVIAGSAWLAGLAALTAPSDDPERVRPKVLIEGDRRLSPFLTNSDIRDTVVIIAGDEELSPTLAALWRSRGSPGFQRVSIPIPGLPGAAPIILRIAVLTPVGASTRLAFGL